MLHWALTAAALLLFIHAVRTVFLSSRGEGDGQKQKLGCGFGLAAALLWMYVLNHHMEDPYPAVRIGIGVFLMLPVVGALANAKGSNILRAAAALILAILIAGQPVTDLWQQYAPVGGGAQEQSGPRAEIERSKRELESLHAELGEREAALELLRSEKRDEIRATGLGWEELQADPAQLQQLAVLGRINEQLDKVQQNRVQIEERLALLQRALDEVGNIAEAPPEDPELEALRRSLENTPSLDELSIVEQHARKKELQELFDKEF